MRFLSWPPSAYRAQKPRHGRPMAGFCYWTVARAAPVRKGASTRTPRYAHPPAVAFSAGGDGGRRAPELSAPPTTATRKKPRQRGRGLGRDVCVTEGHP